MDWDLFFFIVFATLTVLGALAVIYSKEIVRSVLALAGCFTGVAFIFIFLNAEYLGLIQVVIYVGAVSILMLFGIMLTKRRLLGGERGE
jgi:F420H2 dehydrogenase subunit J